MKLRAYITVTGMPSIFLGTALVVVTKDLATGLLYLLFTTFAYCVFLLMDHLAEMDYAQHMYPWGKRD
jgi:formate hydrogenlyase subunit 3/multisubunit Na+/H+ antiporter MnhD subunit